MISFDLASLVVRGPTASGVDGVAYRAAPPDGGGEVVLVRLTGLGKTSARFAEVARRLELTRALSGVAVRRALAVDLDGEVPVVVLEALAPAGGPPDAETARAWLTRLVEALAEAHRFGLVHGAIDATHVGLDASGEPRLDFSGLELDLPKLAPVPPERHRDRVPTPAADVWSLGKLFADFRSCEIDASLERLLSRMTAVHPDARPTAAEALRALTRDESDDDLATDATAESDAPLAARVMPGATIGRYELVATIGEGGMGKVFRAKDRFSQSEVAIKVLLPERTYDALALKRFHREAWVLSQLTCGEVARFIDSGEDRGIHYLVMEHVRGESLRDLVKREGRLSEERALDIAIEVARALADVHDLGVVHRDVKPSNVLLADPTDDRKEPGTLRGCVKLCDFGIAHVEAGEDATALTRAGGAPGTPLYMSPEQCKGGEIDVRTDVYALGATLFHLLAGEPPFDRTSQALVMMAHITEVPPDLEKLVPGIDPELAGLVERTLSKEPSGRHANARELLADLERIRHGVPCTEKEHPRAGDASRRTVTYRVAQTLRATPEELWPYVSDTDRLNRAAGIAPVEFRHELTRGGLETRGRMHAALGIVLDWREHPFEWVAPRRLGVLREHESGPFHWLKNVVELVPQPNGGGTELVHTVEVAPRGAVGRAAASLEIGVRLRHALERVYSRIDEICLLARATRRDGSRRGQADPFEAPPRLGVGAEAKLDAVQNRLLEHGIPAEVTEALVDHLRIAPPQAAAHIRPLALAAEARVDADAMVRACLWATREGALALSWDVICPTCRIPSSIADALSALRAHGHCDACDLDFRLDLARSVELVFRASPSIRDVELRTYCIGGPARSPHVLAQVRLAPSERIALELDLDEGAYVVTSRALPHAWSLRAIPSAPHDAFSLRLKAGPATDAPRSVRPGALQLSIENDLAREAVIRVERAGSHEDAFTAAHAATHPLFRALFPGELLAPHELVGIGHVAMLFAEPANAAALYRDGEDGQLFEALVALRALVDDRALHEGGVVVKMLGDGVMATFTEPVAAVRTALSVVGEALGAKVAVHAGEAMMTTIDGRLDYFGRLVHETALLLSSGLSNEVVVSEAVLGDPRTKAFIGSTLPIATSAPSEGVMGTRFSQP